MLLKSPAIILNRFRFRENKLLVNMYTSDRGLVTAVFYQSKKNPRTSLLEPLTVVEAVVETKANRDLQSLKELRLILPLTGIKTDVRKAAVAMFIAEVTLACTRSASSENDLFPFLAEIAEELDQASKVHTFPATFLLKLTAKLGIGPAPAEPEKNFSFNPATGQFSAQSNAVMWDTGTSEQLNQLLHGREPRGNQKKLVDNLMDYLCYQLQLKDDFKTREVLAEVFY